MREYDSSKKRSRSALSCSSSAATRQTKNANRRLFSAAVLALATLVVNFNFDGACPTVNAFTPTSTGVSSVSTGSASTKNTIHKDNLATRIYPSSTNRRQARQQLIGSSSRGVSSTAIDDESTATNISRNRNPSTSLSSATSPILNHQRRSRVRAANAAKNFLVVENDDQYSTFNHKRNKNDIKRKRNKRINSQNNGLEVQVVLNDDIVGIPSKRSATTSRTRNTKMTRPKSRISSPQRQARLRMKKANKSKTASTPLLTRDEERQITYKIRDLRRVVQIRDELIQEKQEWSSLRPSFDIDAYNDDFPTENDWARACDLDVSELRKVMDEGQESRSLLVSANAGLVTSIAKRHYHVLKQMTNAGGGVGTILTLQDMIQEGNLGLMKAAERFEPERGWRFSTYATYWIRQRILQSITDTSRVIRLPAHGM